MLDLARGPACDARPSSRVDREPSPNLDLEIFVSERDQQPRPTSTGTPRKSWIPPKIVDLPRLENLTLQTTIGPPVDGGSIFP